MHGTTIKGMFFFVFYHDATPPSGPRPPHCREFKITLRHTTLGRNPLDEWSAPRRDLYLSTYNTHNRQTSMPSVGFEHTIPESEPTAPNGPRLPHYRGFTITLRHTIFIRTPLDEWSARRTDLYVTKPNTQKGQISMSPAGFEPTIPASEQPQTYALDPHGHWGRLFSFTVCYWTMLSIVKFT